MEKVICPYCGEVLYLYETFPDYSKSELEIEEHYSCFNCDRTFSRTVKYKVSEKGMLEE